MEQHINVSVIIPVYNSEKYIKRTIESLLNQTIKQIEIICINDGSTDSSLQILKELQKQDQRIKIIDKKNEGIWKARMNGIEKSTGEYITFVDSDDYVEKDFIEKLYKNIQDNKADISICGFKRMDEKSGKVLSQEMKFEQNRVIDKNLNLEEVISVNTALWNKLYKASIIKEIKDLKNPPRILEDMMFLALLYLNVKKISFVDEYLYNYLVRESSAMNTLKENEIDVIQESMIEIKQEYINSKKEQKYIEILSSMAFVHFGISLMLRVSTDKSKNFKNELRKNKEFLNNNFPSWKTTKYLKLFYCIKHKSNIKPAIMKKIYTSGMYGLFLKIYNFTINTLKIDIKW